MCNKIYATPKLINKTRKMEGPLGFIFYCAIFFITNIECVSSNILLHKNYTKNIKSKKGQ